VQKHVRSYRQPTVLHVANLDFLPIDTNTTHQRNNYGHSLVETIVILLTIALLVACGTKLRAQDTASSMPQVTQKASAAVTGDQQSTANSALCSAMGSHFPNATSIAPSALSDPAVMSTAASSFAGSTNLPLPGATDLLKGYVA
jgi:hypothetical protein